MRLRYRVSSALILLPILALAFAAIRDRSNRKQVREYAGQEMKYRSFVENARKQMESCLSQPPGTPYVSKGKGTWDFNGVSRPLLSWADEAEVCRRAMKDWTRSADWAGERKRAYKRRLILSF